MSGPGTGTTGVPVRGGATRLLDWLGSASNLAGAAMAAVVAGGAALFDAPVAAVVVGAVLAYLGGFLALGRERGHIAVSLGGEGGEQVADASRELRGQVRSAGRALPASIAARAGAVLDAVDALVPRWDTDLRGRPEERAIVQNVLSDYLPTALNAYLALPASYLTRTRSDAEGQVVGQLDLLTQTLTGIQDDVYDGVAQRLRAQSDFLRDKFAQGGSLTL